MHRVHFKVDALYVPCLTPCAMLILRLMKAQQDRLRVHVLPLQFSS